MLLLLLLRLVLLLLVEAAVDDDVAARFVALAARFKALAALSPTSAEVTSPRLLPRRDEGSLSQGAGAEEPEAARWSRSWTGVPCSSGSSGFSPASLKTAAAAARSLSTPPREGHLSRKTHIAPAASRLPPSSGSSSIRAISCEAPRRKQVGAGGGAIFQKPSKDSTSATGQSLRRRKEPTSSPPNKASTASATWPGYGASATDSARCSFFAFFSAFASAE